MLHAIGHLFVIQNTFLILPLSYQRTHLNVHRKPTHFNKALNISNTNTSLEFREEFVKGGKRTTA